MADYDRAEWPPLPSAKTDVRELGRVLMRSDRGRFDDVRPLVDPTYGECTEALAEFFGAAQTGDLALVYFSGHGTRLVEVDGEFYFAARDSAVARIGETGVGASWVNEQLEACPATQKVVLLDTCYSGGFVHGFRTTDTKDATATISSPLVTPGVYVLSSSRASEPSYAGAPGPDGAQPSAFTGAVVDALESGIADRDRDGWVSVDDLFEHVNGVLRSAPPERRQVAVKSAFNVEGRIVLAYAPPRAAPPTAGAKPGTQPPPPSGGPVTWDRLLDYYRRCVQAEAQLEPIALGSKDYVCLRGRERLVCGAIDESGSIATPHEARTLVTDACKNGETELMAGYPVVSLRMGARRLIAPLMTRIVGIEADRGRFALRPTSEVTVNASVIRSILGEQAIDALGGLQPAWRAGEDHRMVTQVRELLGELGVAGPIELEPQSLSPTIPSPTNRVEVHNSAILVHAPKSRTTSQLFKDLLDIAARTPQGLGGTALASLLDGSTNDPSDDRQWTLATPTMLNAAQRTVVERAMTRRLTVATGPPGTGKSQLVANVVATAVANHQSVLVASTNNRAVDEVVTRCQGIHPGLLVRTGSRDYATGEADTATELAQLASPGLSEATVAAANRRAQLQRDAVGTTLADVAILEHQAGEAARAKSTSAGLLERPIDAVTASVRRRTSQRTSVRAARLAKVRVLGEWRRQRFLQSLALDGDDRSHRCQLVADFAVADRAWADATERLRKAAPDDQLRGLLAKAEEQVARASTELVGHVVASSAALAREHLEDLAQTLKNNGKPRSPRLRVQKHIPGWAVSALSARAFPPRPAMFDLVVIDEASQCSTAAIIPLLFRARRALLVGDPQQLRHIATLSSADAASIRERVGLNADDLDVRRLDHRVHSAFDAFSRAAGDPILLDEHYRCHPAIAGIANKRFYRGQLTVLTDVGALRSAGGAPAVSWADVRGEVEHGPGGVSWVNPAEVARVVRCVERLLRQLPSDATVGIVTPFAAQKDRLLRVPALAEDSRVRVGTVHTFQGGERDAIVFSLVGSTGMPAGTVRWLQSSHELWNVAITRARAHLIVVGDSAYWRYAGGIGGLLLRSIAGPGPTGTAPADDDMFWLYQRLAAIASDDQIDLAADVGGYVADAVLRTPTGETAVRLDRGHGGADPETYLRRELRRVELLQGAGNLSAQRVPLWRLYDDSLSLAGAT